MKYPLPLADRLFNRWKKKVFANDVITRRVSPEGYEEIVIRRGNYEAALTISPDAYETPRFMLDADAEMRSLLKIIKEREVLN